MRLPRGWSGRDVAALCLACVRGAGLPPVVGGMLHRVRAQGVLGGCVVRLFGTVCCVCLCAHLCSARCVRLCVCRLKPFQHQSGGPRHQSCVTTSAAEVRPQRLVVAKRGGVLALIGVVCLAAAGTS